MARGEGLAREDRDFHLEIVRATQNSVFHKVCSVYYVMGEQRLPIYFSDPERGRKSHAEHLQIFDALLQPRRQPRAGADERASAGRRELLEGPDRRLRRRAPDAALEKA